MVKKKLLSVALVASTVCSMIFTGMWQLLQKIPRVVLQIQVQSSGSTGRKYCRSCSR